ncbi:MAG: hypothetical protein QOD30_667 [Actinomycetota bacterium]|nr:hypothetical protein [Actinomycetota bacterium]
MKLLVGTRKGLWTLRSDDRRSWEAGEPAFFGQIIQHAVAHDGTVLVASSTGHLGPTVFRSTDDGATWSEASKPPAFAADDRLQRTLKNVFWLTPSHEQGVWYAGGCSPQSLFRSDDDGVTWSPVSGWNDHPLWETWCEYPEEQTPDGAMLHSVLVDPRDARHLYLSLSGGGTFESTDGGADWHPLNEGVRADFFPDPYPEFGQDPHTVRMHPTMPDRLYMQNHCGMYRLDRPETKLIRIGDNKPPAIGDIGFPIELHPRDPDTAWVFPMDGTEVWPRTSIDGRPCAYVTHDAGESWTEQSNGMPERAWFTVKRQAMTTDDADPVGVYFGTTCGELWSSNDEGDSWTCVASHLPEIYSVECQPAGA